MTMLQDTHSLMQVPLGCVQYYHTQTRLLVGAAFSSAGTRAVGMIALPLRAYCYAPHGQVSECQLTAGLCFVCHVSCRIQQLDVVLTQLHDSCASAAMQLATAATAAHEAGLTEASAQLAHLQALLSESMMRVQDHVWAGYQQLALADHLSDMLLKIRTSAAEVAASTTAEVQKLHLQQQLAELEAIAESSVTALSNNAMDQLSKLELEQRLTEIEQQATSAAAALKSGLVQQYKEQLPVLQQQLGSLQDTLSGWAADAQHGVQQQNVDEQLHKLHHSLEATAKAVREVAASGADSAGRQLQVAGSSLSSNLQQLSGTVSQTIYSSNQSVGNAVNSAASAVSHTINSSSQNVGNAVNSAASAVSQSINSSSQNVGNAVNSAASAVSQSINSSSQNVGEAVNSAAKTAAAPVQQVMKSAPSVVKEAAAAVREAAAAVNPAKVVDMGEELVAYTPDIESVKQLWEADDFIAAPGVDLIDANDAIRAIWANRPQ